MPLYEIHHICPLTHTQRDELATAITHIHSQRFTTPKLFVQVKYTDASTLSTYIGGRAAQKNNITASVRSGPSRSQADWDSLCEDIVAAWKSIVPMPRAKGQKEVDYSLYSCLVMGGMVAGYEAGFVLPSAGGDVEWLRENLEEMKARAGKGEEEFAELAKEVEERGLLKGGDSPQSRSKRLEEMLGWGEAA